MDYSVLGSSFQDHVGSIPLCWGCCLPLSWASWYGVFSHNDGIQQGCQDNVHFWFPKNVSVTRKNPNFLSGHRKGPRPSTDGLYFCVHYCTTWQYLNIHLWCTHYAWISCTAVQLYCSPVSVRLYRKITLMNRVDQSQLRFLAITPLHPCLATLLIGMLTTFLPFG